MTHPGESVTPRARCTDCGCVMSVCEAGPACFVCTRLLEEEDIERAAGVKTFEAQKWRQRQRELRAIAADFRRQRVLGR
jgi:hypothetical protein